MTIHFKHYIPNTITCLNLFSGCLSCYMAFETHYVMALFFIILSSIFDFFDGMTARLLHAYSPMGKELDSLADDISFGLAPALIVFSFLREPSLPYPAILLPVREYVPFFALLISIFSALRLAKFNIDERQTTSFIGLPVPANALFWGSLIAGGHLFAFQHVNLIWVLLVGIMLSCYLLVSEIPMFSLKFKNLSWKDNMTSYIFLLVCIPMLFLLGLSSFSAIIVWYIILSLVSCRKK